MLAHERLFAFRKARGLSQEALAELLDCQQSYVGLVERGLRKMPGTAFVHAVERVTADWDKGPICTEEWLKSAAEARDARAQKRRRSA